MSSENPLHTVPVPSTGFTTDAYFDGQGITPTIHFSYEKDGEDHRGGIKFSRVAAVRTRAERCCTSGHIEGAYDTLVEIEGSPWVEEIRAYTQEMWRKQMGNAPLHDLS